MSRSFIVRASVKPTSWTMYPNPCLTNRETISLYRFKRLIPFVPILPPISVLRLCYYFSIGRFLVEVVIVGTEYYLFPPGPRTPVPSAGTVPFHGILDS